jgi:hypothetical protein
MPISHDRHVVDLNFCSISLYHDCISDLLEQTCNMSDNINKVVTTARPTRGQGGAGGGQNNRGPECSEVPGNLGKIFVSFIIAFE